MGGHPSFYTFLFISYDKFFEFKSVPRSDEDQQTFIM